MGRIGRLHLKQGSFDLKFGGFGQSLNSLDGQADGAFDMDKIGGAGIEEQIALGREFIIAIPEQKFDRQAVKGIDAITDIGVGKVDAAEAFTGPGQLVRLAGKGQRKGNENILFKSGGKRRGAAEFAEGHPFVAKMSLWRDKAEQGVDIELADDFRRLKIGQGDMAIRDWDSFLQRTMSSLE